MRILVADDDVASRTILTMLLKKSGHEVLTTDNGSDAYRLLCEKEHPHMAILDWMMPGMDGTEVCKTLRKKETKLPVYIIMLTIKGEKTDIIRGLDAGANDYISKPYDPGELHSRIEAGVRIIELQEQLNEQIESHKKSENKIQLLLDEKELLLYEVHHRIKNNINMLINMLLLQADISGAPEIAHNLKSAASRMKTMGIIYDRLYRSNNTDSLSAAAYIKNLVEEVTGLYPDHQKVNLEFNIDDIVLDTGPLSQVGMIINELTVNSMKYAFRGRENGAIAVNLHKTGKQIMLQYSDDGTGLPDFVSLEKPTSFGLIFVNNICSQLGGNLAVDRTRGTSYFLTFALS